MKALISVTFPPPAMTLFISENSVYHSYLYHVALPCLDVVVFNRMRVLVTKLMETIEISDDETDTDEVQIVEVTPPPPPQSPPSSPSPPLPPSPPQLPASSDPELEAALACLDKETEKKVHSIVQEITQHVESDMWRHAYQTSNQEKKVICVL